MFPLYDTYVMIQNLHLSAWIIMFVAKLLLYSQHLL